MFSISSQVYSFHSNLVLAWRSRAYIIVNLDQNTKFKHRFKIQLLYDQRIHHFLVGPLPLRSLERLLAVPGHGERVAPSRPVPVPSVQLRVGHDHALLPLIPRPCGGEDRRADQDVLLGVHPCRRHVHPDHGVLPTGAHTAGRRRRRGEHDERRGRRLQQIEGHLGRVAAGRVLREDQVDVLRERGGGRRQGGGVPAEPPGAADDGAAVALLSFSDVLLTTGVSTFGYMSSSLAGLRPTMLMIAKDHKVPETPCVRAVSMEPCFHMTPDVKCQGKAVNKEELSRHVKECEDVPKGMKWIKGIKLVD
ncbi:uncharacterized protein [Triticum aestivum]|uniref:uncharacterized protein n=1 Tax=Triticum aestivum TaxID=4565 RepID=UPI001D02812C|nr:uncharacterized protein LOC123152639 [Triticum aestivum]